MATFRSLRWALLGAAIMFQAQVVCAQDEAVERKIETKVVVVGDEGERDVLIRRLGVDHEVDCHEENGRKICFARAGHGRAFAGTFLGVHLTDSTPELREHLGGPRDAGVLVSKIEEESPAALAGIQVGDIVTAVDGETVASAEDLRHAIASREAGEAVAIELYRDGRLEQVSATLARREPFELAKRWTMAHPNIDAEALSAQVREALEGIDLDDLDEKVRQHLDAIDWEEIRETVREALDRALEKDDK